MGEYVTPVSMADDEPAGNLRLPSRESDVARGI